MDVKTAILKRRAYRSLAPAEITAELIKDLAQCAQLAPSCFNNQPWRYVFIYETGQLSKVKEALSSGNEWAEAASMIIAVVSKRDLDCVIRDREYVWFDTGMATAHIILRATERGLVAHPIAGFSQRKAREALDVPPDFSVLTLIIVGKHSDKVSEVLSQKQQHDEGTRPLRLSLEKIAKKNIFSGVE